MENYWAYSAGMFETNETEVKKLDMAWAYTPELFQENLIKIRKYFGERNAIDIIEFTVRKLPEKRGKFDNAVLLVFKKRDGSLIAKRHHNSQYISLDYGVF